MSIPLKLFIFLGVLIAAQMANADLSVGLGDNIKSVTITEFAPQGRTVVLSTPETIEPFVSESGMWNLYRSHKITRDFFNMLPVRYLVTVQGESIYGEKYDDVSYFAVMRVVPQQRNDGTDSDAEFRFVLYKRNEDGSFNLYREGPTRGYRAPDTPLEQYLTQLFPPRGTEAIHTAATRKLEMEGNSAWLASSVTLPVWILGTIILSVAATVYLALMLLKHPKTAEEAGQAVHSNRP
jgi:hypothetical protein